MIQLPAEFLRGSFPPLVTPLRAGQIDLISFQRLVRHHRERGSHGVVVCGTTGEPSILSIDERVALVDAAVAESAGRLTVIAATGSQSLADTVELTHQAEASGADAVLVVTPYYVRPPQRGLIDYFAAVASETELPVMLYHIPGRAATEIDVATLDAIALRADNFIGMKHASYDLALVTDALLALGTDFRIHVGLEELSFPMLALGACGLVNAIGNIVPERVRELYEKVSQGDLIGGLNCHRELWDLNKSVFFEMNPIPVKYMLKRLGVIDTDEARLPMASASSDTAERCDLVLARAGLIG